MKLNTIYNEDCLETMFKMNNDFIDMVITSPPYDNLRKYKGFNFEFEKIATELYRIIKDGGVLVWVVGDATINGSETGTSFKQALYFKEIGFNIHDTMIYKKDSISFPEVNRYSQIFEYMFILSKGKPKTFNCIKDRINKWGGDRKKIKGRERQLDNSLKGRRKGNLLQKHGSRDNVWQFNVGYGKSSKEKIAFKHPAIFPIKLAKDHIYSWSNENDIIYDCFMGSGTTAVASLILNRKFIGSEVSKEYTEIANKRLIKYISQKNLFYD